MSVLFVTGSYLPYKNAGIENYVHLLASKVNDLGVVAEVATLKAGNESEYFHNNIKVHNLKGSFDSFQKLIENGKFTICHFQEYSAFGGIELTWIKYAKQHCSKVYFTFHLPYLTCYKNDFRFNGIQDCNHFTNANRCVNCVFSDKLNNYKWGRSELLKKIVRTGFSFSPQKADLKRKIVSFQNLLGQMFDHCDEIFVTAEWFRKILISNGYPETTLLPYHFMPVQKERDYSFEVKNKLVFIGRIEKQKGLHLLCEAMSAKGNGITLDVYGNKVNSDYFNECKAIYDFNYKGVIAREELLDKMNEYDFLVLPSVFTEMYPLVIHEAFGMKLPVIVSASKGNADAVDDGVNGFVFEYDNAGSLASVLYSAIAKKKNGWKPDFRNKYVSLTTDISNFYF